MPPPQNATQPRYAQPTFLGRIVNGIAILIMIAGVAVAAFTGVPIPGTDFVIHSVLISVFLGALPGMAILALAPLVFKKMGLKLTKDR